MIASQFIFGGINCNRADKHDSPHGIILCYGLKFSQVQNIIKM